MATIPSHSLVLSINQSSRREPNGESKTVPYRIIIILGNIKAGLPSIALPPFSLNRTEGSNNTVFLNFGDICGELGPGTD